MMHWKKLLSSSVRAVCSHPTNLKLEKRFNMCTDFWNYTPVNYLTLKDFVDA